MRYVSGLHLFINVCTIYLFVQSAHSINLAFEAEAWVPEPVPEVGVKFPFVHQSPYRPFLYSQLSPLILHLQLEIRCPRHCQRYVSNLYLSINTLKAVLFLQLCPLVNPHLGTGAQVPGTVQEVCVKS